MHRMWRKVHKHHEKTEKEERHPLEWPIPNEYFDQIWTVVRMNEKQKNKMVNKGGDCRDGEDVNVDVDGMSQLKELIELMEIHGGEVEYSDEECDSETEQNSEVESERGGDREQQESIVFSGSEESSMMVNSDGVSSCTTVSDISDTIEDETEADADSETRYYTSFETPIETQLESITHLFSQSLTERHLEQLQQRFDQPQQPEEEEDTESSETDSNTENDEPELTEVKFDGAEVERDDIEDETEQDIELRETVYRYLEKRELSKAKINNEQQQEDINNNGISKLMELSSSNTFSDLFTEDDEVIGLLCKKMVSHINTNWTAYSNEQTRHRRWVKKVARRIKEMKGDYDTDDELED
ncbi:unnamed protein product [Ambrosiozyma monospora]|uniref:Unnamed protein product n=1 Tax=Ambrosiozyma monospora TaxID=43982 RepID=A0ACB5U1Y8_AMBMO|nr:unnamed protein product [Ambrosiozyma monospora]